jgi:hypothetical protein
VDFVLDSIEKRVTRARIRDEHLSLPDPAQISAPVVSVQEAETLHAAEPPASPETCYYIPMPKVPYFLGREEQMIKPRRALDHVKDKPERRIATLWGEEGIGKTQLALHYAEKRKRNDIPYIFWIASENQATVDRVFSPIAVELNLPGTAGHGNHINNIGALQKKRYSLFGSD